MSLKNPNRDIHFFKHDSKPIVYVLMSLEMSVDEFYEMFKAAQMITEDKSDLLVLHNNYEVVYIGDSHIIDTHFTE